MTMAPRDHQIDSTARTVRQIFTGSKFAIDYYQREYKWGSKQVMELLEDLTNQFFQDYQAGHERKDVASYGNYFLGSFIVSRKGGQNFLVDGHQRLTTLTLLLIYLYNRQRGLKAENQVPLDSMIYSQQYGEKSFNLNVDERQPALDALFTQQAFDDTDQPESVRNMIARYQDIVRYFAELADELPEQDKETVPPIDDTVLPYFIDWLVDNVQLVEIRAYSDDDAYTIFETMNDRGLSLSQADRLKGYVLSNITDSKQREQANQTWKERMQRLADLGKEEGADAIKAWLRSQYAQTIRDRTRNAKPMDFDRLGTEFHRWVREHEGLVGLKNNTAYVDFVQRDLVFYTGQYERARLAACTLSTGLESIFYNAQHDFTLQYPLLLAPLVPNDDPQTIDRKLRIVATFVDILIARRLWNSKAIAYSTMQYAMFLTMREIRDKAPEALVSILSKRLSDEKATFASNASLRMHQQNHTALHLLLARLTDYIEQQSGLPSHYTDYVAGKGSSRYEVEHIWAQHPERHAGEFPSATDFVEYRNRIGGLLLLPRSFNASFGDLPYEAKLEHYYGQNNLLAKSLHPKCYSHNPGFQAFIQCSQLPFRPHEHFLKSDLDERQDLYRQIAEKVWSPERLERELAA